MSQIRLLKKYLQGIITGLLAIQFILVSSHVSQSWQIKKITIYRNFTTKDLIAHHELVF